MGPIYLALAIAGTLLPLSQLVPFLAEHGLDVPRFFGQLFGSRIPAFFALDVVVSTLVLWAFVLAEGRRLGMGRLWAYVLFSLTVGVSLALPAFLYAREHARGAVLVQRAYDLHGRVQAALRIPAGE